MTNLLKQIQESTEHVEQIAKVLKQYADAFRITGNATLCERLEIMAGGLESEARRISFTSVKLAK